jgi:hypothetical protein
MGADNAEKKGVEMIPVISLIPVNSCEFVSIRGLSFRISDLIRA